MVEGHPVLRQQIGQLCMKAAEELLVRQHAGSVPWRNPWLCSGLGGLQAFKTHSDQLSFFILS